MKKVIPLSLFLILFFQAGVIFFLLKLQQFANRNEMREEIKNETTHFEKLFIPLSEFKHIRINDDEILLQGKMYDIKSARFLTDKVELVVLNDSREENILEQIKRTLFPNDPQHKKTPIQLSKLLSLLYLPVTIGHQVSPLLPSTSTTLVTDERLLCYSIAIPSPPPKQATNALL